MSKQGNAAAPRLSVGKPTPMPEYPYQSGWNKSASLSVKRPKSGEQKFAELANFKLQSA